MKKKQNNRIESALQIVRELAYLGNQTAQDGSVCWLCDYRSEEESEENSKPDHHECLVGQAVEFVAEELSRREYTKKQKRIISMCPFDSFNNSFNAKKDKEIESLIELGILYTQQEHSKPYDMSGIYLDSPNIIKTVSPAGPGAKLFCLTDIGYSLRAKLAI